DDVGRSRPCVRVHLHERGSPCGHGRARGPHPNSEVREMSAPVKLCAVAGMAIGLAIIALAKCSPPPKPGNPAFALTTVAQVNQPIAMAVRTGDDALSIAEWDGHVRAIRNGAVDPTPVLDISRLTRAEGERGLLGLAFSPDGKKLYLDY